MNFDVVAPACLELHGGFNKFIKNLLAAKLIM